MRFTALIILALGLQALHAGHLISTNRDTSGDFSPLRASAPGGTQGKPSGIEVENLTQEVRKIKGSKFQLVIFGILRVKDAERSVDKVQFDFYTSGWGKVWDFPKYVGKKVAKGKTFTLRISLYDKDNWSRDDLLMRGFQTVNLLKSKNKDYAYEGKFKFLYEIPFSKIRKKLGPIDHPRIYARVEVEKGEGGRGLWSRLKNRGTKSDVERVYLDSEFSQNDDETSKLQFFDGIEVPGEVAEDDSTHEKKNLIKNSAATGQNTASPQGGNPGASRTVEIGKPIAFPYSCADLRYYSEVLKELDTLSDRNIRAEHRGDSLITTFPNPMERGIVITDEVMEQQIIVFRSQSAYLKDTQPEEKPKKKSAPKPPAPEPAKKQQPAAGQGFYQPHPFYPQGPYGPPPGYQPNPYAPPGYQPNPYYPPPPPPRRRRKKKGGMFSMFKSMNPMSMMGNMMGGMMGDMNPMSMMGGMPGQGQAASKKRRPKQMITVPTNEYLGATTPGSGTCKQISGGNYATANDLNKIYGATPAFTGGNPGGGSSGGFMDFFNMPMKMMTMPFETFNRMMDNGFKGIDRFGDKIDKFGDKIVDVTAMGLGGQSGGSVPCVAGGGGTVININTSGSNNVVNVTLDGESGVNALKGSTVEEAVALYAKVYQEVKGQLKDNYRIILAGPSEDRFLVRIASMYFYPEDIAFEQIMINEGLVQDLCSVKGN